MKPLREIQHQNKQRCVQFVRNTSTCGVYRVLYALFAKLQLVLEGMRELFATPFIHASSLILKPRKKSLTMFAAFRTNTKYYKNPITCIYWDKNVFKNIWWQISMHLSVSHASKIIMRVMCSSISEIGYSSRTLLGTGTAPVLMYYYSPPLPWTCNRFCSFCWSHPHTTGRWCELFSGDNVSHGSLYIWRFNCSSLRLVFRFDWFIIFQL